MHFSGDKVGYDDRKLVFENGGVRLTDLGEDLQEGILRVQPLTGRKPEPRTPSPSGTDIIIMRKDQAKKNVMNELSQIYN